MRLENLVPIVKLTNANNQTLYKTQWGADVTHQGIIHCYPNIILALLLDPIHCQYLRDKGSMWAAHGKLLHDKRSFLIYSELTTTTPLLAAELTTERRLIIALLIQNAANFGLTEINQQTLLSSRAFKAFNVHAKCEECKRQIVALEAGHDINNALTNNLGVSVDYDNIIDLSRQIKITDLSEDY